MCAKPTDQTRTRALFYDIKNTLDAIEEGQRRLEAFVKEQLERINDRLEQHQLHQASCDSLIDTTPAEEDYSNENNEPGMQQSQKRWCLLLPRSSHLISSVTRYNPGYHATSPYQQCRPCH